MSGQLAPYKLVGDAAYPMRQWFYSPFEGEKEGLPRAKAHWNFIQSSTRMAVERVFGILKGRWRILLKRIDMPLRHIPSLVSTCICLYNLCIIHKDMFDNEWAKESEDIMRRESSRVMGQFEYVDLFNVAIEGAREMRPFLHLSDNDLSLEEFEDGTYKDSNEGFEEVENTEAHETRLEREAQVKSLLIQSTQTHELMGNSFLGGTFAERG